MEESPFCLEKDKQAIILFFSGQGLIVFVLREYDEDAGGLSSHSTSDLRCNI